MWSTSSGRGGVVSRRPRELASWYGSPFRRGAFHAPPRLSSVGLRRREGGWGLLRRRVGLRKATRCKLRRIFSTSSHGDELEGVRDFSLHDDDFDDEEGARRVCGGESSAHVRAALDRSFSAEGAGWTRKDGNDMCRFATPLTRRMVAPTNP
mmetsp:Transcript_13060/g.39039  ORF Transcript_13060/g.39039 Transcript_13060/m.39039 type:complete len:152 (+) Transcript_13060:161-616(+)